MGLVLPPVVSDALKPEYTHKVNLWVGTQAEYNALPIKVENTLYMVIA